MYVDDPNPDRLRQGDVLEDFFFPRYSLSEVQLLHTMNEEGDLDFSDLAVTDTTRRFAVVISQCCEFTGEDRNAFSVSPLKPVSNLIPRLAVRGDGINLAELVPVRKSAWRGARRVEETIEWLREANDFDVEAEDQDAISAFLYEPDGEVLEEAHVANFTRVASINMGDHDRLTSSKRLQLTRPARHNFQNKLGYFYARKAEEVEE